MTLPIVSTDKTIVLTATRGAVRILQSCSDEDIEFHDSVMQLISRIKYLEDYIEDCYESSQGREE